MMNVIIRDKFIRKNVICKHLIGERLLVYNIYRPLCSGSVTFNFKIYRPFYVLKQFRYFYTTPETILVSETVYSHSTQHDNRHLLPGLHHRVLHVGIGKCTFLNPSGPSVDLFKTFLLEVILTRKFQFDLHFF